MEQNVQEIAKKSQIPIIRFEKDSSDAYVLMQTKDKKSDYQADSKTPWRIDRTKDEIFCTSNEISLLSDIQPDIETLVCCLIIGVYMENESLKDRKSETLDYLTPFAIYLLKVGKWIIPKQYMKLTLGQESLGYIYQKIITIELIRDLWKTYNMRYKLSVSSEQGMVISDWNSECYGVVFIALLQNHYWDGATQLVKTGYIGIRHILFGCVILEEEERNWKTTTFSKEVFQRLKIAYTERAILITSCIYDADRKKEDTEGFTYEKREITDGMELGDEINHGGRLLLNHGYLRDAINTRNITFLENDTVKKIVNKKWYGVEKINWQTLFSFVFLAAVHVFVLPILMITMETGPLLRVYKKYNMPFLKVVLHMMGFVVLITAYAYMLLFDHSCDGISNSDCFIMAWIVTFFVDEMKQVIVAFIRDKLKRYTTDWWNIIDWLFIIVYTFGMLLKVGEGSGYEIASKCVLVTAFMLLCIRILNLCCMTEFLGPKLVIIRKMIKETVAFMTIMTVIMVWYSVSFYSLLYPNSEFSWAQIEKVLSNGYWMLFGELNLDVDTLTVPYCTFNRTLYESGVLERCPTQFGLRLIPYLKAFYGLIAVVLLLNLLIAMYSDTFNAVQQKTDFYWRQIQSEFLEEYSIKTVFPMHLQLLALPGTICALLCLFYLFLRGKLKKNGLNDRPMVIRVFLYDTNYDLELQSTKDAEGHATIQSKGKIYVDFDSITNSQKENDSSDKRELMNRLQNMEHGIHMLHQMIEQLALGNKGEKTEDEKEEEKEDKKGEEKEPKKEEKKEPKKEEESYFTSAMANPVF